MSAKKKITLDCGIFGLQNYGGISNYWLNLINHISQIKEFTPNILFPKTLTYKGLNSLQLNNLQIIRESINPKISRYLRVKIPKGIDLFHTSYYRLPSSKTDKYVVTAYDFTYERYRSGLPKMVHSWQKLQSIQRADVVLCISESTKQDIIEFYPFIDSTKLQVVHLGVDRNIFYPDRKITDYLESSEVLFVGQRDGYKRFDLAVDAVRECSDLTLGIVGPTLKSPERDYLTKSLGIRWRIYGPVQVEQLRRIYSNAFAFIFPSDYEGFGLPILEAMACGCPVIAANRSSFPEIGGSAILYSKEQSGKYYAENLNQLKLGHHREYLINKGFSQVEKFTWKKTFKETIRYYLG